ncbi:hypothetical protein DFH09DRAFT_1082471 [Mycena vulgaris]|nr:hypothetical protein DFH09DRAFT_1082471 [Mycena vulgaris]
MAAASWHLIGVGLTLAMVFARRCTGVAVGNLSVCKGSCNLTLNNAGSLSPPTPAVWWIRFACGLSLGEHGAAFWNQFPESGWEKSRNPKDENFKEGRNDHLMIANIRPRKACYVPTLTMEQRACATPGKHHGKCLSHADQMP